MPCVVHGHALERSKVGVRGVLDSAGEIEAIKSGRFQRNVMSLTSVANPAWRSIRGVRFSMLHGPTIVAVLVTHDAVDDVEHATAGDGGPLARFTKHRDRFELAASAKHQRGQIEEGGLVIVDVADLKGASH
jgi:hypothetical protein